MPKRKEASKGTPRAKQAGTADRSTEEWLSKEQKPFFNDTDEVRGVLERWGFSAQLPLEDTFYWVYTTLPMTTAMKVLTDVGRERVEQLFSTQREYSYEDWALLRPGWWESIERKRERGNATTLRDYWGNTPPDISGVEVPVLAEHWWNKNIRFKTSSQESDPKRRIAYLIVAGLLKDVSEDGLVRFVASKIENPSSDTRYAEWGLTKKGWKHLATPESAQRVKFEAGKSSAGINFPDDGQIRKALGLAESNLPLNTEEKRVAVKWDCAGHHVDGRSGKYC